MEDVWFVMVCVVGQFVIAEFRQCPKTIFFGKLEQNCGPDTDWLCNFECDPGYIRHPFMLGKLKGYDNQPEKLLCGDDGKWKTGYEDLDLREHRVCVEKYPLQECSEFELLHGTLKRPCRVGYPCEFKCDAGYHPRALQDNEWIFCIGRVRLELTATKYDAKINPYTVCAPDLVPSLCSNDIPNGHVPDGCTRNCVPVCNKGYYLIEKDPYSKEPITVTCENRKWLTESEPYTGDNVCFPEGGIPCSPYIPHGLVGGDPDRLRDYGTGRTYMTYQCYGRNRNNRGIYNIECVGGKWVTWNERFGIDVDNLCIPTANSEN